MDKRMIQPQFKFGDKVVDLETGDIFVINCIFRWVEVVENEEHSTFAYNQSLADQPQLERLLSPYKEPKKKKLFAWKHEATKRYIFTDTEDEQTDPFDKCERAPLFDIKYPEVRE